MTFNSVTLAAMAREMVASIGKARALLWVDYLRKAVEQQNEASK